MCYNYTNNKDKAGECMQAFETDRNQVEIIEDMTIEYPYWRRIHRHVIRRRHSTANLIPKNLYHLKELPNKTDSEFQTQNILSETWGLLIKKLQENLGSQNITGTEQTNRLRSMIVYINQHYPEKITLAEIAKAAGVSERESARHLPAVQFLGQCLLWKSFPQAL